MFLLFFLGCHCCFFDQRITLDGLAEEFSLGFGAETLTMRVYIYIYVYVYIYTYILSIYVYTFGFFLKTSFLLKPHHCDGAGQR